MRDVNQETITDTQSWYKILPLTGFKLICEKKKLLWGRKRVYKNFSSRQKSKSHLHWQIIGIWKISWRCSMESSYFNTPSRRMVLPKERYAEWKKERLLCCCNHACMKNGGLILWNAAAICEMSKTSWQVGKPLWKVMWWTISRSNNSFCSNGWILSDFCTSQSRLHQFGNEKFYQEYFLGMHWSLRGMWTGDILVADIEELNNMNASEIHPRRINAKEVLTPQRSEYFIFQVADGTAKLSGRDNKFREPTHRREQRVGVKIPVENFKANQKTTLKPGKTSGQSKVCSFIVITLNFEFNCTCWKKNHSQLFWKTVTWPGQRTRVWMYCRKVYQRLLERRYASRFVRFLERIHLLWSVRKLEVPLDAAILCKKGTKKHLVLQEWWIQQVFKRQSTRAPWKVMNQRENVGVI